MTTKTTPARIEIAPTITSAARDGPRAGAAASTRARPLRIQVVAKTSASTASPVTRFRRQSRPAISTTMPTMPDSTLRPTPAPVGRNAATIRARPPNSSQTPVSAAITRSEMSGQISTASPSSTANRPVTSRVHQGNGCLRNSVATPGHGSATSVMPPASGPPHHPDITPHE
ncbi:hypothetical protein MB27_35025 [Actinoplanes utahensis]|uniref:Uncharacterized protein n=1 Tax=Actinoplanes utahensis TaxID=1869 RepID=A0A0A6UBL0_ACTUT|nr:hypothetical protein MB27_35025 [Actinoplanes utahensis]